MYIVLLWIPPVSLYVSWNKSDRGTGFKADNLYLSSLYFRVPKQNWGNPKKHTMCITIRIWRKAYDSRASGGIFSSWLEIGAGFYFWHSSIFASGCEFFEGNVHNYEFKNEV